MNITIKGSSATTFAITSSILPPPLTITDDPAPTTVSGVKPRHQTRTITPPPYPYSTTSPGPHNHPLVTHSSGTPRHPCKSGCGHKCRIFCDFPCLLNCPNPPSGFDDPNDPDPPPGPNPPGPGPNPDNPTSCTVTSTVTDFWVSCSSVTSSSASCTTTSSKVVKGCDVTASDTTTGSGSCPTINPEDDQGSDGDSTAVDFNTITAGPTATPAPKPSCAYHGPDPQGMAPEAWCVCDSSLTFPELPGTSSCDYSTLPSKTTNPVQGSLRVVTSNCQVCTQVNANEDNCSPVAGCTTGTTASLVAPTPTFTPRRFYIGYVVYSSPGGGDLTGTTGVSEFYWEIFSGPQGSKVDTCGTPDYGPSSQIDGDPKPNVLLGPFNAGDRTDCTYAWNKPDKIGGITCGDEAAVCHGDKSGNRGCHKNDYSWVNLVTCDLA